MRNEEYVKECLMKAKVTATQTLFEIDCALASIEGKHYSAEGN